MKPSAGLRRPRLWLAGWIALQAATLVVCLLPMPAVPVAMAHFDKIEHLAGYALLAAYTVMLFPARRARWRGLAVVFALGAAIEALQSLVPWRSNDALDLVANAAGIALGALVAATPLRGALAWCDARLP